MGCAVSVQCEKCQAAHQSATEQMNQLVDCLVSLNKALDEYWNAEIKHEALIKSVCARQQQCKKALTTIEQQPAPTCQKGHFADFATADC